jgi:hypothetical protein
VKQRLALLETVNGETQCTAEKHRLVCAIQQLISLIGMQALCSNMDKATGARRGTDCQVPYLTARAYKQLCECFLMSTSLLEQQAQLGSYFVAHRCSAGAAYSSSYGELFIVGMTTSIPKRPVCPGIGL